MLSKLDDLTQRCEAALRRAELSGPAVAESIARVMPWAPDALGYLDKRGTTVTAAGDCTLPELFHALRVRFPELTLPAFHDGVKRLHDLRALRLKPATEMAEPEYSVVADGRLMYAVGR